MDKKKDDDLWQVWLHTTMDKSFKDFKKQQKVQHIRRRKKRQQVTETQENALLAFASQFVKPKPANDLGGET